MKSFPMFIKMAGRRVVIAGGGEQAAQKARLILKTEAEIVVAWPELEPELAGLVEAGRITWARSVVPDLFEGAAMAFVATGCPGTDASLHGLAQAARCPVNVVDRPDLCDLTTPSLVDRDPVVVAIGTEGTAPVLARQIKTQVEEMLAPNLGGLAALAGRLRGAVAAQVPRAKRRAFWAWVFKGQPRNDWTSGAERAAAQTIKEAIAARGAPEDSGEGIISLVGAGPGARDLLTMRAVARLQEADVIFYDRLVDAEVLELARRDAERVFVGKVVGANAWPQDRINALIVAAAKQGQRVVRLKSGDPGIFGRAGEEAAFAEAQGVRVEIVPGVTAACAAAASMGTSLTERGTADTVIFATAQSRDGAALPEAARHSGPGTTLALYMGVAQAGRVAEALMSKGMPDASPVRVAANVSKAYERHVTCTLSDVATRLEAEGITGCATILITWPEQKAQLALTA